MSSTESKGISEIVMKLLLFLGIFAVAAPGGKNEYKFETGINLTLIIVFVIYTAALMKLMEIKYSPIEKKESDN